MRYLESSKQTSLETSVRGEICYIFSIEGYIATGWE